MRLPRPLDPMVSIKAKLGVVVVGTVVVTVALIALSGLVGVQMRYSLPVGAVLAVGFVQLLGHGITTPLREMATAARAMARGDYSRRVHTDSRDEVGELARAFNTMAADLAAVDEQRKHLVATVSHELRTPISALQALLENIVDGVTAADEATLRTALTQTQRLGRLVTQLLDLSRLESGAIPLHRVRVDVRSFLADVVAQAAVGRNLPPVVVAVTPDPSYAEIDADRLHQVFANLLDNAARHASGAAAVSITATQTAEALRVVVTDDGPGIAVSDRERVFDAYTRLSATDRDGGGTGLGLAIARWIVSLHGGTLSILDTPTGCSIAVDLPHPAQEHL